MVFLTDRKRATGMGTAKTGTAHLWGMTVSSVALLILVPLFIFTVGPLPDENHATVTAYFSRPFPAIVALLTFIVGLLHFKNGVTVLIEDYFQGLKSMVADYKLDEDIQFLGGISSEELLKLYQSCGIFVFPSTVETFGNPLVEAMACGASIACSNTAAMPEVVGDAAEFFDPNNVESIAQVINKLLKNEGLRQSLSKKALKRAKAFSWQNTADKTLAVIKKAVVS